MIRDVMEHAGQTTWPIVALLIMLAAFTVILLWTFSGKKNRFEHDSRLPLDDDDHEVTHNNSARG